jgi:hypothetical protein
MSALRCTIETANRRLRIIGVTGMMIPHFLTRHIVSLGVWTDWCRDKERFLLQNHP